MLGFGVSVPQKLPKVGGKEVLHLQYLACTYVLDFLQEWAHVPQQFISYILS